MSTEKNKSTIQNYISSLIDLQEQFNPDLNMMVFLPYLFNTDIATIKSNLEEF